MLENIGEIIMIFSRDIAKRLHASHSMLLTSCLYKDTNFAISIFY